MEGNREKAWSHLTDQEKQSIYLTLGQGLSGYQACEILNMTRYKYLELKARAETLFKVFTDYYDKHGALVRHACPVKPCFRDYIDACLVKRLEGPEAATYAGEGQWSTMKIRHSQILEGMLVLQKSDYEHDRDLYLLVQEFDRWNNYRILPKELQMPTPYRRKENRVVKSYFKYLRNIPPETIHKLSKTLAYGGKDVWYIALITKAPINHKSIEKTEDYLIVPIKKTDRNRDSLSVKRIYIFAEEDQAREFALMVVRQPYVNVSRDGMDFWRDYSKVAHKAINYEAISHTSKIRDFYDEEFKDIYLKHR